jgi:hypothetical protein
MIGPAVGVQRRRMAASVIAAKDPHFTDAGFAQFAECDFLRVGRHGRPPKSIILKSAHSMLPKARQNPSDWPSEEVYKPAGDGRPGSADT